MTLCIFCSANIPSDQLDSHINTHHPTFISSKPIKNHSFLSHNMWQSTHPTSHQTTTIGKVYDTDILKPLIFLDGKRINCQENLKKHKRHDHRTHHKRPHKRRKLNTSKHKKKHKPKPETSTDELEEGEEDPYGGLPYHFHLATHMEPKFIPKKHEKHNIYTNIKTLLHNHNINIPTNHTTNNIPCKLHDIQYKKDHLSLSSTHHENTPLIHTSMDHIHVYGTHKINKSDLNRLIMADLTQYNFITNATQPSTPPPPSLLPIIISVQKNKQKPPDLPPMIEIMSKTCPNKMKNIPIPLTLPTLKTPPHGHSHGHGHAKSHGFDVGKLAHRSQMICMEDLSHNRMNNASPTTSNTTSNSTNSMCSVPLVGDNVNVNGGVMCKQVNILNTLNALNGRNMNVGNGYMSNMGGNNNTFSLLRNFGLDNLNLNSRK